MKKNWSYKNYQVEEGLKPGSKHFQYFFIVSDGGENKCNYCVWIEDDALTRFDRSGNFDSIASSQGEKWNAWVREKIDAGDLRSRVLKFEKEGEKEIDLSEMKEHLTMD